MPGFKYVGTDYTADSNANDVLDKLDVDTEFSSASVSQSVVLGNIQAAVATYATQTYVGTQLAQYAQLGALTTSTTNFTLAVQGSSISGSFTLTYGTQSTVAIAWEPTAAQIRTALQALTNINSVTVTGGGGGVYVIAITPLLAGNLSVTNNLTNGTILLNPGTLIPTALKGKNLAPLNGSGVIPSSFIPSLGAGYVIGPFGSTATFGGSTGAVPMKIADWSIGPPGVSFQPMVFMNCLVSAASGGRPVIEVRMSAGVASYTNQTLIGRGVGRSNWNDSQAIQVLPTPSSTGHTGVAGSGFAPTYNLWLSAWLYDANSETVTINTNNIANTACFLVRHQQ